MTISPQSARYESRCPLLLAALGYAAGILIAQHCWRPRLWWLAAAVALLAGAAAFAVRAAWCKWRGWAALGCVVACAVALGALGYDAQWAREPDSSGWESLTDGEKVVVTGYVVRDGVLRGSGASHRQSVDVQLEAVELPTAPKPSVDRAIGPSGHRTIEPSGGPAIDEQGESRVRSSAHRGKRQRKSPDPCMVNAAWPAELLAASGMAGCAQRAHKELDLKRELAKKEAGDDSEVRPRTQHAEILRSAQENSSKEESNSAATSNPGVSVTPIVQGIVRISIYGQLSEGSADGGGTQGPSTQPLRGSARDDSDSEANAPDETYDRRAPAALPHVFTYGQRLRFAVKLRPPRNFGNPGSLDYAGHLRGQGIRGLGSVRADRIEVIEGSRGTRWALWRSRVRRSVIEKIHALWPHEKAGVLDAMLIGERSFIGRETSTAFQRTGIYHILVVSGMNVGILALVVFWMLRRLRCGEVPATVVTILLACGYAYVAEAGAPIVRSVVMLAIYLCTRLLYRERAMLNALGAAALVLMIADPRTVTDASFQLTILSVLAICGIAVPVIERTSQPCRVALRWLSSTDYDMSLDPRLAELRIDLRILAGRLARFLPRLPRRFYRVAGKSWRRRAAQSVITATLGFVASAYELLVVSFATQIALALPMAWYFHRATVAGLPANLIAVPLTGVLMPASVSAVALSYVGMPLARVPAWIALWSVNGITWTVNALGGIRAADLRLATPEPWLTVAAAMAFVLSVLVVRRRRLLAAAGLAALCATALCIAALPPKPHFELGKLEITAMDVGQAESFLVVTPQGRTLLVDAAGSLGPWQSEFDFGEDVVAPYLWSRGITRLDAVAITHAHSDHYGGMASIVRIFRPGEMWVGPNAPDRGFDTLVQGANQQGVRIVRRFGGEAFTFGGAQVRVLAPVRSWRTATKPRNDDSLVLWLRHGSTSALLEADAEKASEREMMGSALKSDLLKVGHNGSNTSSTPGFLAQVQPTLAVISVGARNSFGHPRPEVLERLAAMHVHTYRTDLLGAVTFLLDGARVTAKLPMLKSH